MTPRRPCPTCPRRQNPSLPGPIVPSGPTPCDLLFLGEQPAKDEVRYGYPFAGRTGRELDRQYLPMAGLNRPSVRVGNARLCPAPRFDNPTKEDGQVCAAHHLPDELCHTSPLWLIPMGAVACSLFPEIDLELHHGIPRPLTYADWHGIVYPMYHPSIGLHEGSWMKILQQDWSNLSTSIQTFDSTGDLPTPYDHHHPWCPVTDVTITEVTTPDQLLDELPLDPPSASVAPATISLDTEVTSLLTRTPYCFSICHNPSRGLVIYMDMPEVVSAFSQWASLMDPLFIFHNYLFDFPVCQDIGIPIRCYDDTMVRAYNLQDLPLGLKPLSYRLLGHTMQSFDDLVYPYASAVFLDWLASAHASLDDLMRTQLGKPTKAYPKGKVLKSPRYTPGWSKQEKATYVKLGKLLTDMLLKPDPRDPDPWKRMKAWHDHDHDFLASSIQASVFPPPPDLSITHVPRDLCTPYAGWDAVATLRLLPHMKERARILKEKVQYV